MEYYYGIHDVTVPLQELNWLAIDRKDQWLIWDKDYWRTENMGFFKLCTHLFPNVKKKKLLWNLLDTWNNWF